MHWNNFLCRLLWERIALLLYVWVLFWNNVDYSYNHKTGIGILPIESSSISCEWPIILFLFCLYLANGFVRGFSKLPLKILTPFFVFTLFGFLSLVNAVDVAYSVNKLILWLLAVALLIIVIDNASKSKKGIEKYINFIIKALFNGKPFRESRYY